MKKKVYYLGMLVLLLILGACSGTPGAENSTDNGQTSDESSITGTNSDNVLSESTKLMMGTVLLDESEQIVDTSQAGNLLTLWKAYRSLVNSETSAEEEVSAVLDQIKDEMTTEQLAAIEAMGFTNDNIQEKMQELGIEMGRGMGFDFDPDMSREDLQATREAMRESGELPQGMGPGGNRPEGEGIPFSGVPPAEMDEEQLATLQAMRGTMGGRGGIDRFMINAVITYLEGILE